MPTLVGLFRAVNVGGRGSVAMRDVCAMATRLGLDSPRTLLQSGNLIFTSPESETAVLERSLEAAAKGDLGLETSVFVRRTEDWVALVEACPYPDVALDDPSHLLVMLLRDRPTAENEASLRRAIVGRESFELRGATAYISYPDGIGRSKLTAGLIERCLGITGTARNWNTVLKIASALAS